MIDGSAIRNKKIQDIKAKLQQQPLYGELFSILQINIDQDFMQAELLLEQITIGQNYVKIIEPSVSLLDFFRSKNFSLHSILPAYESENFKYPVTAWLEKS